MKVFIEEQRFRKWWLIVITLVMIFGISFPFIFKNEGFPEMGSDDFYGITIAFAVFLLTFGIIFSVKLSTKINEQGIYYKFFPINFSEKFIPWSEINSCEIRKFNIFSEYGGYGYKVRFFGKNKGKSLTTGGNIGLQLKLKNGKSLLIGTQKQQEIESVLKTYKEKFS